MASELDQLLEFKRTPAQTAGFDAYAPELTKNLQQFKRGNEPEHNIDWWQIGSDIAHTPIDLLKGAYNFIGDIPQHIESVPQGLQEFEAALGQDPKRAGLNALAGFGEFGNMINRIPANFRDYMIKRGANPEFMQGYQTPQHDFAKEFVGEQQPGDAFYQTFGKIAPELVLGGTSPARIAGVSAAHEAGEGRNPLTGPLAIGALTATTRGGQALNRSRNNVMATEINEARDAARAIANQNYTDFNASTQNAGVNAAYQPPRINAQIQNRILEGVPGAWSESFENYLNNGQQFNDSLQAVSDLRAYGNRIRNMPNASPEQIRAGRSALDAANSIQSSVDNAFIAAGHPELVDELQRIRTHYDYEVIPFKGEQERFNLFNRNKISGKNLVDALIKDEEFMHVLGERFPGFATKRRLKTAGKITLGLGGIGTIAGGAHQGYKLFAGEE